MKNYILSVLLLSAIFSKVELNAQQTYRALFLGNSYTGYNNLPQMIADVALSAGDTLIFDLNVPGGYRLFDHRGDAVSQNKIQAGAWDYVVLQEQSRTPILYPNSFGSGVRELNNTILEFNPCSETILYMTWGRKNGDASNCAAVPVMCTYGGMDSTLKNSYLDQASLYYAEVSPVSVVWNHLRQSSPGIELYNPDESHPSLAGSYAAACCFYATLFKKDPTLITFNGGLSAADAAGIRSAAKIKVFDDLSLWDFKQQQSAPESNFDYQVLSGVNEVFFLPRGIAENYFGDFGDGTTSTLRVPSHSYLSDGTYTVTLKASNCSLQGIDTSFSSAVLQFCSHTPTVTFSYPWCQSDTISTEVADTYQWYNYQWDNSRLLPTLIPETNQFIVNHGPYGSIFKVASTVNGCTEMSETYYLTPQVTGYYFDAATYGNDPCIGDTVQFSVLHINGSLPGSETIDWYKDGNLLPSSANDDTLFITSGGTYKCRIIAPNSICPIDTTWLGEVVFSCGGTAIETVDRNQNLSWKLFPNPASETITIEFSKKVVAEPVQIYNLMGYLVREAIVDTTTTTTELRVSDLPNGIYFVRLKNRNQGILKLIIQ
jgi:PKD repeat protein